MDRVPERLQRWWNALDDRQRRHGAFVAVCGLAYVGHFLAYTVGQPFYIEDAGITFAYARNFVQGDGFSTWPGGERVEGYSNALWTFLVAGFYALGVSGWVSSKLMGAVFGVLTLPLAYDLTRRALAPLAWRPQDGPTARPTDALALLAPALLALSPQIVIWNASGLENSLFGLLLLAAGWRLCVEHDQEAAGATPRPWSALLLFLLTMTRPDGLMYAAIGLFARVLSAAAHRRLRALALAALAFALPFLAYNAWRYWYFAWPFPNTYYAKLGTGTTFQPFNWEGPGWKQVRGYFFTHKVMYALPLLPLAMTGLRGRRRAVGLLVAAWLSFVVLWDGKDGLSALPAPLSAWLGPVSSHWVHVRVGSLLTGAVLVGLVNLGRPGWLARGFLWASMCSGIFFMVYSGHDWMKAWRWFNLIGFSMFPLLVVGVAELLDGLPLLDRRLPVRRLLPALPEPPLWSLALAPVLAAFAVIEVQQAADFVKSPEVSVRDIRRRVDYMQWVQRRLDVDHITLLDVDMGAHMYFTDWKILDIAGLVEVPIARHRKYDKAFVRQYIFEEEQPDFGHVHSSWARTSRIDTFKEWKERYLEIPGYPIGGRKLHVGNHIKKALFVTQGETFPDSAVADSAVADSAVADSAVAEFAGGVRLLHLDARSPVVPAGGQLYLHLVFQAPKQQDGFRVLAFLDDGQGHRAVSALTPGLGWYPPEEWKRDEQVHGRFPMPVSADLPPGEYQLGLVLLDEARGTVRALRSLADQPIPPDAPHRYLPGEHRPAGVVVTVTDRAGAEAAAAQDLAKHLELAGQGACEESWTAFKDATRHLLADTGWRQAREEDARTTVAACLVARARAADDEEDRIAALVSARRWDHHVAGLAELARPEARTLVTEGDNWAEKQDWERAYARYALALELDPRLSHVRRKAEDARDYSLDIREPGESYPPQR